MYSGEIKNLFAYGRLLLLSVFFSFSSTPFMIIIHFSVLQRLYRLIGSFPEQGFSFFYFSMIQSFIVYSISIIYLFYSSDSNGSHYTLVSIQFVDDASGCHENIVILF